MYKMQISFKIKDYIRSYWICFKDRRSCITHHYVVPKYQSVGEEGLYNLVCHSTICNNVRQETLYEFHNLTKGEPIFTKIGMWPPYMIFNKLASWPLTSEVIEVKMEVKYTKSISIYLLVIWYLKLVEDPAPF